MKSITSRKISIFFIFAILWGIPLLIFSISTILSRANIEIEGVIIERQMGKYLGPHQFFTDYTIRQSNGDIAHYRAESNDPSLSREIDIGTELIKKKWKLSYTLNGKEINDFPLDFYTSNGIIGGLIFILGIIIGILRGEKGPFYQFRKSVTKQTNPVDSLSPPHKSGN